MGTDFRGRQRRKGVFLMWCIRLIHLGDGRQRWFRTASGPIVYRTQLEAAAVAAIVGRNEPIWFAYPVEIDSSVEEIAH